MFHRLRWNIPSDSTRTIPITFNSLSNYNTLFLRTRTNFKGQFKSAVTWKIARTKLFEHAKGRASKLILQGNIKPETTSTRTTTALDSLVNSILTSWRNVTEITCTRWRANRTRNWHDKPCGYAKCTRFNERKKKTKTKPQAHLKLYNRIVM